MSICKVPLVLECKNFLSLRGCCLDKGLFLPFLQSGIKKCSSIAATSCSFIIIHHQSCQFWTAAEVLFPFFMNLFPRLIPLLKKLLHFKLQPLNSRLMLFQLCFSCWLLLLSHPHASLFILYLSQWNFSHFLKMFSHFPWTANKNYLPLCVTFSS